MLKIINNIELDSWLFEHANIQGHQCDGIKEKIKDELVNIKYIDRVTKEEFIIKYDLD